MRTTSIHLKQKPSSNYCESGFTLVELTLVLVVLAILSAVVGTRFFDLTPLQSNSAIKSFSSAINYSRNNAITAQCTTEMRLLSSGWSVWRDENCNMTVASGSCPSNEPLSFTIAVNNVGEPTQLTGNLKLDDSSGNSIERLIFTPQGQLFRINSASTGCDSLPANAVAAGTTISNLIPSATLRLDGLTGYAALQ